MKPVVKTSLIALTSALIGAAITAGTLKFNEQAHPNTEVTQTKPDSQNKLFDQILKEQTAIQKDFDSMFDDHFFKKNDPFGEMKNIRKDLQQRIENLTQSKTGNPFDTWFGNKYGGSVTDITQREDANNIYYYISVDDLKSTSINTNIKDGQITITGQTEKKNESQEDGGKAQSIYQSSFQRTFPLPENVDQHKMQMSTENNKVILKFPKLKV